jgi:hypothetical protein
MSLFILPCVAENAFTEFLLDSCGVATSYEKTVPDSTETDTAQYNFIRSFSADPLQFPAVIVKVGELKEKSPGTGIFDATLAVAISTQIDDAADAVEAHTRAANEVFGALADSETVKTALNGGAEFHLWQIYTTNYDNDRDERLIQTVLEYAITCQMMPTNP